MGVIRTKVNEIYIKKDDYVSHDKIINALSQDYEIEVEFIEGPNVPRTCKLTLYQIDIKEGR